MVVYEGLHDEQGFQVYCQGKPLPLHLHYTRSRDWRTEPGLRQVALDILIHHLSEDVDKRMLALKDTAVAAWLPHLDYAHILIPILWLNGEEYEVPVILSAGGQENLPIRNENHVRRRYGNWSLSSSQIQLWLDDWMHETHTTFLKQREPTASHTYRYAEWEQFVREGLATDNLDALGLKLAWRFRWYLTGFSVKALTTMWQSTH
jgi:hypothetical protein